MRYSRTILTSGRAAFLSILLTTAAGCNAPDGPAAATRNASFQSIPDDFGDYWYQGKAEITSYGLVQARYGAQWQGSAVTIFVTEDFSREKQVKLDDYATAGSDAVKVLKMNSMRDFNTGIYPYSTMTSVFTPVYRNREPHTVKATASVQEWCGQTFAQLNHIDGGYSLNHFSYFESDGDGQKTLPDIVLEDEVWNLVRLSPGDLPRGEITALPSMLYQRFSHSDWAPARAVGTLQPSSVSADLMEYRLSYTDMQRELLIRFRRDFPHEIEYWEETSLSGFGADAKAMTTRGTLKKRIMIDYWTRNKPGDEALRHQLAL